MTSKLFVIRHGSAPKVGGIADSERSLDAKGIWQCETRRQMLGNVNFDFGFASPLKRAQQSLMTFMGSNIRVRSLDELDIIDPHTLDGHIADIAFNLLGYKPLTDYFKDPNVKKILTDYGRSSCCGLMERLVDRFASFDDSVIGICGHAVNLPATLRHLALANGDYHFAEYFEKVNMQELDGFMIEVDRGCNILKVDAFASLPEYQSAA